MSSLTAAAGCTPQAAALRGLSARYRGAQADACHQKQPNLGHFGERHQNKTVSSPNAKHASQFLPWRTGTAPGPARSSGRPPQ